MQLGIVRPRLHNGLAIANVNTLIYTLINLRLLRRKTTALVYILLFRYNISHCC